MKMEPLSTSSSLLALIFCFLATLALLSKLSSFIPLTRKSKPPPGPKPWPIIGNLNLIGPIPHQSLHKLSQTYGPLMQLKFGSFPVVVASSGETAKQVLKTHDHVFASRPRTAAGKILTYDYLDVTWAPHGEYWRQARKIFATELFSPKRLHSFEYIRVEETRGFLTRLFASSGKPVMFREHISRLMLATVSRIVLGKDYFNDTDIETSVVTLKGFQDMLDELVTLSGVVNIGDWIPWLGFLDMQGYVKQMKTLRMKLDNFHGYILDEHKARTKECNFAPKDMVDLLLKIADDDELEVKLTLDSVKGFTQDLIAGGTDTSATNLEWAMSELMKNPTLIKNATLELDKVIGKDRWVKEKDLENLHYINAIMKETMRLHPVVSLLAPHLALEDCDVKGYRVEKGTRVFVNTWSIGRDRSIWEDRAEVFDPGRFLGRNKGVDVKGQSFELLPFGSGRRMCPGYGLGLRMIQCSLANMLHGFEWRLCEGVKVEDLSMEEAVGLSTPRKFPLVAVVEPRLPVHLYR